MRALNDFERRRHGAAEPHTQAALSGRGSEDCAVGAAGSGGATGAQGLRAAAEREQANRRECGSLLSAFANSRGSEFVLRSEFVHSEKKWISRYQISRYVLKPFFSIIHFLSVTQSPLNPGPLTGNLKANLRTSR